MAKLANIKRQQHDLGHQSHKLKANNRLPDSSDEEDYNDDSQSSVIQRVSNFSDEFDSEMEETTAPLARAKDNTHTEEYSDSSEESSFESDSGSDIFYDADRSTNDSVPISKDVPVTTTASDRTRISADVPSKKFQEIRHMRSEAILPSHYETQSSFPAKPLLTKKSFQLPKVNQKAQIRPPERTAQLPAAAAANAANAPNRPRTKYSTLRNMKSIQSLNPPKANATLRNKQQSISEHESAPKAGEDELHKLMSDLSISKAEDSPIRQQQKPQVIKQTPQQKSSFFQKLQLIDQQRKVSPVLNGPRLTPYNGSAWKTNPILNGGLAPKKQVSHFDISTPPSSKKASDARAFNKATGMLLEPLTPKSSQWSNRTDIAALRKPVPFNINKPATANSEQMTKEQMILTGKIYSPKVVRENDKVDIWEAVNKVGSNQNVYISPQKAKEAVKDLLDVFKGEHTLKPEEIESFKGVDGLEVTLMPHQIEGLRFLQRREDPGLTVKGGLLCDDMGLGKTIQSIALILSRPFRKNYREDADEESESDKEDKNDSSSLDSWDTDDDIKISVKSQKFKSSTKAKKPKRLAYCISTLVVAPLALAQQWAGEIRSKAPGLRVVVHHGPKRATSKNDLHGFHVVITTYQILASEFESRGPLFKKGWWRVIVDEAHSIKNRKAKSAVAACALQAHSRWCLTGTPIQNNADELYSLMKFLRVSPFDDYKIWTNQISRPLAKGQGDLAMQRLHVVLSVIMLRRTKAVLGLNGGLSLPARKVERKLLDFNQPERSFYDAIHKKVNTKIHEMFAEGGKRYLEGLLLLLRLRQICDHKDLAKSVVDFEDDFVLAEETQGSDELVSLMGGLNLTNDNDRSSLREDGYSTKMRYLLKILVNSRDRKTIVFSQFTTMLDIIEPSFRANGIKFVRYDGSMKPNKREESLERLRNDGSVQVLLCSLKCGALGLNLTCASQVVLLDPWWNPMVSEQAIDRVHRLGQTQDVIVHELIIKGTVEEQILALQDKKRALASGVVDKGGKGAHTSVNNKLTMDEMLSLFN